jgi:hypothetical protein
MNAKSCTRKISRHCRWRLQISHQHLEKGFTGGGMTPGRYHRQNVIPNFFWDHGNDACRLSGRYFEKTRGKFASGVARLWIPTKSFFNGFQVHIFISLSQNLWRVKSNGCLVNVYTIGTLFAIVSSSIVGFRSTVLITIGTPFPGVPRPNDHWWGGQK